MPTTPSQTAPKVICRPIEDDDLRAVVDLLMKGFAGRRRDYWRTGFARQKARDLPFGCPRYGLMLECEGVPVGVMLMLFATVEIAGGSWLRCNLSSWYVEPAYAAHSGTLVLNALKRKTVTYTNISPARHTLRTVEAVRFQRYTAGYFISMPFLQRLGRRVVIRVVKHAADAVAFAGLPERDLLVDHAAMGCLCLVVEDAGEFHPFVFLRFRIQSGRLPLPMQQLVFCRGVEDFLRFSGPLGRFLLWRGAPLVAHDSDGPVATLPGFFRRQICGKYYRGQHPPRLGDLAYSERVIFGP